MTDVKLEPCPFCGGEAQPALAQGGGIQWAQVECVNRDCGAVGPTPATEAEAIAAWNRRHQPQREAVLDAPATYAPPGLQYAAVDQNDLWLLRFSDQDCGDQWFGGEGWTAEEARREAIAAWNRYAPAWSVRLMRTVTLDEVEAIEAAEARAALTTPTDAALLQQICDKMAEVVAPLPGEE